MQISLLIQTPEEALLWISHSLAVSSLKVKNILMLDEFQLLFSPDVN